MIELAAGIFILALLAAMFAAGFGPVRARAEGAICMGHMRSLHVSLASYIQDKGEWPQEPDDPGAEGAINEGWWLNELAPYGADPGVWLCPTIKRMAAPNKDDASPKIHYLPGAFDSKPTSPFKYAMQPWLIEIAGVHGRGPNVCFPDASIRPMDDIIKK